MSFWRHISPRGAIADLIEEWKRPSPYRWYALGLAIAATTTMMVVFLPKDQRIEPRKPQVTWITSWRPDRTTQEIVASNVENQRRKEEAQAVEERRTELRKDMYRQLGRATGIDVDKMEAEIERERAAEEAAAAARRARRPSGE